jgi:hypothetical protein
MLYIANCKIGDWLLIIDEALAKILEVVPDVLPQYALELYHQHTQQHQSQVHVQILHLIFENPDYPKVVPLIHVFVSSPNTPCYKQMEPQSKKRPLSPSAPDKGKAKEVKIDYGSSERVVLGGPDYYPLTWVRGARNRRPAKPN